MAQLSAIQQTFLQKYSAHNGKIDDALEDMNLDRTYLAIWANEPSFQLAFRKITTGLYFLTKQENAMLALMRLNETLKTGYEVLIESSTKTRESDDPSKSYSESNTKTIRRTLSSQMLAMAITNTTYLQAIEVLANEGVLSEEQAKKLISTAEEMQAKSLEIVAGTSNKNNELNNAEKAEALLKQALIGIVEDIQHPNTLAKIEV